MDRLIANLPEPSSYFCGCTARFVSDLVGNLKDARNCMNSVMLNNAPFVTHTHTPTRWGGDSRAKVQSNYFFSVAGF